MFFTLRIDQNLDGGAIAPPGSDGPVFHFCSGLLPAAVSAKISSNGFYLFKFSANLLIILGLDQRKKNRHYLPIPSPLRNLTDETKLFKNLADIWSLLLLGPLIWIVE